MDPSWLLGAAIAFGVAAVTTPAGVSGAVLLLPAQVSLLGVSAAVATPTNLVYNAIATPGAIAQLRREGGLAEPLARALVLGAVPGVVVGAVLRDTVLTGEDALLALVAAVLVPLGLWLLVGPERAGGRRSAIAPAAAVALAAGAGVVGGLYGLGGGSIVAPALVALGLSARAVAGPALLTTFVTSVVGVIAYEVLAAGAGDAEGPDWGLGLALGVGGLAGGAVGARLQPSLPEGLLRRGLGVLILLTGARYAYVVAA